MVAFLLSATIALLSFSRRLNASPTPAAVPAAVTALDVRAASFSSASGSSSSSPSNASETSSSAAATHTVQVGKATNQFVPDVIQASVGDLIEFDFFPANHSVIRAAYKYPCVPYELTVPDAVGFFSGFRPVDAVLNDPPKWTLLINDTDPVFFYCGAPGSCINFQMVGVINPNASTSLAVQKQLAKDSSFMLEPGEDFPAEASASISSLAATATGDPVSAATSPTATQTPSSSPTPAPNASGSHGLSSGAIAGIAIGGAAVLVLAAALFYFIGRDKRKPHDNDTRQSIQVLGGAGGAPTDMIHKDGVLYAPIAHASPEYKHGSVVLPPMYDAMKSPSMSVHPAGFSPLTTSVRSPSPTGSNAEVSSTHGAVAAETERPEQPSVQSPSAVTSRSPSRSRIHEMFAPFPDRAPP